VKLAWGTLPAPAASAAWLEPGSHVGQRAGSAQDVAFVLLAVLPTRWRAGDGAPTHRAPGAPRRWWRARWRS
jgi:hypothetical protein